MGLGKIWMKKFNFFCDSNFFHLNFFLNPPKSVNIQISEYSADIEYLADIEYSADIQILR